MPIYEYECQACGNQFEFLVMGKAEPACPACSSQQLERLISLPSVHSAGTREMSMRAARKREAGRARERVNEQRRYEKSHDRHG